MRILVAEKIDNKWQRIGIYYVRKDKTISLPLKYNGSLLSYFIKQAVKVLDNNINYMDYQYGSSPEYRIALITE